MIRKIEFFKITYDMKPAIGYMYTNQNKPDNFIKTIVNSINKGTGYEYPNYEDTKLKEGLKSKIFIETKDINEEGHFGIIARSEDSQKSILRRLRRKEDNIIDIENGYYIEDFTYFYVNFSTLICTVLTNNNAPKFKMHYRNYLKSMTLKIGIENISINNLLDENIDAKLNKMKSIKDLNVTFDKNSALGNELIDLKSTLDISQDTLINANIKFNLTLSPISEKTKTIFKNNDVIKSNFTKFEIDAMNDDNNIDAMDLVERILMKRVTIDIDDKYLKSQEDLEKIKEALIKAQP